MLDVEPIWGSPHTSCVLIVDIYACHDHHTSQVYPYGLFGLFLQFESIGVGGRSREVSYAFILVFVPCLQFCHHVRLVGSSHPFLEIHLPWGVYGEECFSLGR